jgi:AraC-like DNA-binding protein
MSAHEDRPGVVAQVVSRVEHRVRTLTVRDVLIGRIRAGRKTLVGARGEHVFAAGELFIVARGTQWDVINDPRPEGCYVAQILVPSQEVLRQYHALLAAETPGAQPVRDCTRARAAGELGEAFDRALAALQGQASAALCRHRLFEVLLLLAEAGILPEPGDDDSWSDRVRRLIGQRPHADWTIDALAGHFHVSPSTLRRRIAEDGTTLGALVREVRLACGLALLQGTDLPVGEIAARCGYDSHSRFSAAFRQRYGFAPSRLRPAGGVLDDSAQALTLAG